ncbi:MAG: formate--tetrahydrofolate ligase [Deltaproteobacteria bacterium]|nr:formate--tetrahydrofolate ligase [Deltaproteobacteria bacterium]
MNAPGHPLVLKPIAAIGDTLGLQSDHVLPWGRHRAKIDLAALNGRSAKGKLVLVSAINPTPAGEGKTTMSVALAMGLRRRGKNAVAALREPSLGPVFGVKGGGTGGGRATIEPQDDINLHFTGDIHAVTAAHNLLAALVDNAILYRDPMEIDPRTVTWPRAMDMNDRSLRNVIIGLGGKGHGIPRESRFDITAASEVMAILCLAKSLQDLQERCSKIIVGTTRSGDTVRAGDVFAGPAMAALLRDALMPNLAQTAEGGPAIVHGGPFANIAHGCNSVLATEMALAYGDVVVTEAGFGFDLGGEKFMDIKTRVLGKQPDALVLVATVRSLKYHGGQNPKQLGDRNDEALRKGMDMLEKHLDTAKMFALPCVVVLNRFPTDSDHEHEELRKFLQARGVTLAVCSSFVQGGEGALEFADAVTSALETAPKRAPRYTYALEDSIEQKLSAIATKVYGAKDVQLTAAARDDLARIEKQGGGSLPVCVAKTHLSLSDVASAVGRPKDFTITVRELRHAAGAGFVVALTGELLTMPGLPKEPSARRVSLHADGRISGLMQGG